MTSSSHTACGAQRRTAYSSSSNICRSEWRSACSRACSCRMPCVILLAYCLILPTLLASSQQPPAATTGSGEIIEYNVFEELPPNTFVGNIKTNSNLLEKYGQSVLEQLELDFHQGPGAAAAAVYSYFRLDRKEGTLRTARPLDREQLWPLTDIELSIRVTPFTFFQILKVIVHIIDKNDNVPIFPESSLTLSLSETTRPDSLFAIPNAEDADSGRFGVQIYELVSSPGSDRFDLVMTNHSDGTVDVKLKLARELDRETRSQYDLTLIAWDGGQPPQSGSLAIVINVVDANDNSPIFTRPEYVVQLRESAPRGTAIVRVSATDLDTGLNGQVVYSLAPHNDDTTKRLFAVNSTTGDVTLMGTLDFETARAHTLAVMAHDLGQSPFSAFTRVVVHVEDVNDNAPIVTVHTLTGHSEAAVWENSAPGTFVTHLAVTDADDGDNGKVDCITDGRMFELVRQSDSEYRVVTRGHFDSEDRDQYHVRVSCSDNGQPSLMASKTIIVNVLDENDNAPFFPRDVYYVTTHEGNMARSIVVRMNATDRDTGMNGALTYSMTPLDDTPPNAFAIEPVTGLVRALETLDYEKRIRYAYIVTASDAGPVKRSATATLNITVVDVNDERPQFVNSSYVFVVPENVAPPHNIGYVIATDADEEPFNTVVYSLSVVDEGGVDGEKPQQAMFGDLFSIDKNSGLLVALRPLDREEASEHHVVITASNDGYPDVFSRINVSVRVGDVNDNVPSFVFPSPLNNTVTLPSDAPVNAVFARLRATDADADSHLTFHITSGHESGIFIVDSLSGELRITQPVAIFTNNLFKLRVSVSDGSANPRHRPVTADLSVLVLQRPETNALSNGGEASESGLSGSLMLLHDNYFVVVVGVLSGVILIVLIIVLFVICMHCRKRRGSKPSDRYVARCRSSSREGNKLTRQQQAAAAAGKQTELHSLGRGNGSIGTAVALVDCNGSAVMCKQQQQQQAASVGGDNYGSLLSNGHAHKGNSVRWVDLPSDVSEMHPLTGGSGDVMLDTVDLCSARGVPLTIRTNDRLSPQGPGPMAMDWSMSDIAEAADTVDVHGMERQAAMEQCTGLQQLPPNSPCLAPTCPQSACYAVSAAAAQTRPPRAVQCVKPSRPSLAQPSSLVGLRPGEHHPSLHYRSGHHSPMTSLNDGDSDGTESITDSGRGGSEEGEHFGPRLLGHHLHHPHHHLRSPNTATASSPETLSLRPLPCPSPARSLQSNRSISPRVASPPLLVSGCAYCAAAATSRHQHHLQQQHQHHLQQQHHLHQQQQHCSCSMCTHQAMHMRYATLPTPPATSGVAQCNAPDCAFCTVVVQQRSASHGGSQTCCVIDTMDSLSRDTTVV